MYSRIKLFSLAALLSCYLWGPATSSAQEVGTVHEGDLPMETRSSGMEVCSIPFVGQASGGTLILADTLGINARFVAIETLPGESADSVAARLAEAINEQDPFRWQHHTVFSSEGALMDLIGGPGGYIISGTENGLGIPPAPLSVTCNYDRETDQIHVRWQNSASDYEYVRIRYNWDNYNHTSGRTVTGSSESSVIDAAPTSPEPHVNEARRKMPADIHIWVVGVRNGVPSNAAAMHMSYNVQEERYGIPFSSNTAPNWTAWSLNPQDISHVGAGVRERLTATKNNRFANNVDTADEKPFYQILKPHRGGPAGVTRSFLGLTPGHKYRVTIRMNTYGVDSKSTNWAYLFHAVCTGPEDRPLSPRQMAGMDPLPQRAKDFNASRVVEYGPKKRTGSAYKESVKELVVPEGADAITVWLSFRSARPGDQVTMDYIKLEDLGAQ